MPATYQPWGIGQVMGLLVVVYFPARQIGTGV